MTGLTDLVGLSWPGGSPENTGLIVAVVVGAYLAAFWLAGVVWTGRDIRQRSDDPITQVVAVLIVFVFNLPGWMLYRVLRPTHTLEQRYERQLEEEALLHDLRAALVCPRCGGRVDDDYIACPRCAAQLRRPCNACERPLDTSWLLCPWCGEAAAQTPEPLAVQSPPPAATQTPSPLPAQPTVLAPSEPPRPQTAEPQPAERTGASAHG